MAHKNFVSIPADVPVLNASLNTVTSTAEIVLGPNVIFEINSDQDINIAFGVSGMAAASASDWRVPANTVKRYDTGNLRTSIRLFNPSGSTSHYWVMRVTQLDK